jgi:hypothetical protein
MSKIRKKHGKIWKKMAPVILAVNILKQCCFFTQEKAIYLGEDKISRMMKTRQLKFLDAVLKRW